MAVICLVVGQSAVISNNEKWSTNNGNSNPRPILERYITVPPPPRSFSKCLRFTVVERHLFWSNEQFIATFPLHLFYSPSSSRVVRSSSTLCRLALLHPYHDAIQLIISFVAASHFTKYSLSLRSDFKF